MIKLIIWLLIVFIIMFVFSFLMYLIFAFDCSSDNLAITYKQFKSLCTICPDKWEKDNHNENIIWYITKEKVSYGNPNDNLFIYNEKIYKVKMKYIWDAILMKRYFKNKEKRESENIKNQKNAKLLKEWQKDINTFYQGEYEWMLKEMEKIVNGQK